jgi:hypothetical protein
MSRDCWPPGEAGGAPTPESAGHHHRQSLIKDQHPQGNATGRQDRDIRAAVAAADHLLARGLTPIFDLETAQAMWAAGYHRIVAQIAVSEVAA